jgi:hypothetical protein
MSSGNTNSNFIIKTPHAAVIIWNYDDRFGSEGVSKKDAIDQIILSTVSCKSISVSKSKSDPQGTFQIDLAPTKNWVSAIAPGSWCAILMSNLPIQEADIRSKADYKKIKMFGKIESVRVSTVAGPEGQRMTNYTIVGVDWGHVFHNKIYIDSRIPSEGKQDLSNALAIDINTSLFGDKGLATVRSVRTMLLQILDITGKSLKVQAAANDSGVKRLASAVYSFQLPQEVVNYFQFIKDVAGNQPVSKKTKNAKKDVPKLSVKKISDTNMNSMISLITGKLVGKDKYSNTSEAFGYINPLNLQGMHTFWQVLLEHSNPPLNEMIAEFRWEEHTDPSSGGKTVSPKLALYNRIKPFSIKNGSAFKNLRHHDLDSLEIISVEAGTNWRDKYNFAEIKPIFENINLYENWYKQYSQQFNSAAFGREGFRPLITETRQFPGSGSGKQATEFQPDYSQLKAWSSLLKEWYFDNHKLLNGTLVMVGVDEYIAVGDNIKFDAAIINPNANLNSGQVKKQTTDGTYILAHVENISHSFRIEESGARTFITTIQFVRGILVDSNNEVVGEGKLDKFTSSIPAAKDKNTKNTIGFSESSDPDPEKLRGN